MRILKGFLKSQNNEADMPPELFLGDIASRIHTRLTSLGYCRRLQGGEVQTVRFQSPLGLSPGKRFGFIRVDVHSLPRGVKLTREEGLAKKSVLRELSLVAGRPVAVLTGEGSFIFVVDLKPVPRERLPKRVEFDLGQRPDGEYMIPLGVTADGPLWTSLLDIHHVLVAGATGSGKSNALHGFLCSLLAVYGPDELKLAIIDPKGGVELAAYDGLPHLVYPIAIDVEGAEDLIRRLGYEMESRQALLKGKGVRDWGAYNDLMKGHARLPLIIVVIDEFLTLTVQAGGSALNIPFARGLAGFVSQARALGFRCFLSASMPKSAIMDTVIREACTTRFSFWAVNKRQAGLALGEMPEGIRLPSRSIRGRALVRVNSHFCAIQTYHCPTELVADIVRRAGSQGWPVLTEKEGWLARYALKSLDGAFNIGAIYDHFGPAKGGIAFCPTCGISHGGISYRQLVKIGQQWEHRGWLLSDGLPTTARQVSPVLIRVLEADRAGTF